MIRGWRVLILVLAAGTGVPALAQALPEDQTLVPFERYTSVRDRRQNGGSVAPIPLGSFELRPTVDGFVSYNDNVFAREDDRKADVFLRVSPTITANSSSSRSQIALGVATDIDRYASLKSENSENVNASAYAARAIGRSGRIRGLVRYQTLRESREAQDVFVETRRPVRLGRATVAIGGSRRLANTLLSLEGNLIRTNYDDARLRSDGRRVDEDFRDSTVKQVRARAEFGQFPSFAYFVQATYRDRDYSSRITDGVAVGRGSHVAELLAGARFELPVLARGEIGIGYTRGTYQGVRFNTRSGLAISSEVTFFPTQLTNVVVSAERRVSDASLPGSSGYTNLVGGVRIDHELLRSLLLSAGIRYERDKFNGVDRLDRRIQLNASGSYRLGRHMSASLSYQRLDLSSRGVDRYKSFLSNRVMLGWALRV